MKRRIFISIHYMKLGGAETALVGLLRAIDYAKYDVDLFLYACRGELIQFIPKEVNLLPEIPIYAQIERPLKSVLKDGYFRMVTARLKAKVKTWLYKKRKGLKESDAGAQFIADAVTPLLPPVNPDVVYDLAISFIHPHNIVRDKVRAKKKICWIHTDYSSVDVNADMELPIWSAFDHVVSISGEVTKAFLQTFPSLDDKIVTIENIVSSRFVRSRANEFDAYCEFGERKNTIILLSIGRFCEAKNYDNVPDICRRVISILISAQFPHSVKWFIIGYGPDEQLILDRIADAEMQDHVIILGKKVNPYPYIKACDIYVQPSRYEGKSVTIQEAQILCKPVVVTNYPTVKSQIIDGVDGKIAPLDNEGCSLGLADFIMNTDMQKRIVENLQNQDMGNEKEVKKLYKLMN